MRRHPDANDIHQHHSGCTLNALLGRHAGESHSTRPMSLIQDGYRKRYGQAAQDIDDRLRRHVTNNFDAPIITTTTELKTDPATESRHLLAGFGRFRLDENRNSNLWLSPSILGRLRSFASRTMLSESLASAASTQHRVQHGFRITTST
jgi:hypothetical protein